MYVCLALSELSQNWIIMLDSVKFENHVAVRFVFQNTLNLITKHLMTGTTGSSEFCIPEILYVLWGEAEENIEVEWKQNSLFPTWPVMKCFVIPRNSKTKKKKREKNRLLDVGCNINLTGLQEDQPDHVRVESSSCCFPRELVSFVRPRRVSEFWPTARDTLSSNRRRYFGWEI